MIKKGQEEPEKTTSMLEASSNKDKRRYIFRNLEAPQAFQYFSVSTLDGIWERVLVPGATVELNDWEYNYIMTQCAKPIPPPPQDIETPDYDVNKSIGLEPRFQLQPVL